MYKSLYGLGSATRSCASYSLSAPSQHVATYSRQCFSMLLCVDALRWLKRFIFPGWIHTDGRIFKEIKRTKTHSAYPTDIWIHAYSNKSKFFSFPFSPVSISLDTQVHCCFVFSSCNGLPGTCGFCLCFAHSSSFLSAAQCTSTLC